MSTTGRSESSGDAATLAERCREAAFVRIVARPDGDAIAAAGLLGRACAAIRTPYQVSVAATRGAASDRLLAADDDATLALGFDGTPADATLAGDTLSTGALAAARELHEPAASLALAGVRAAGSVPSGDLAEAFERRPGVGLPVADLSDGLAHATRLHADWSGDDRQAGALLAELDLPAELDDDARRRLASRVALDATENAAPRAVGALDGVLRPHVTPDGPFETAEGHADVLDCLAVADPGLASALALGVADRPTALDAWREHASATHAALRTADPARYSGLVAAEADAPAWPLARLLRDTRADEPAVLVVGDAGAALATAPDGPDAHATIAAALGDDVVAGASTHARTDESDAEAVIDAVRGVLSG
ncbi:hypothetical protein [Halarchaeum nitratireducens]|uniref:Exonuclease RecJ n=1 Tax=Halarchaeum nitratireducens TaxID=489913 RepID=A0A830GDZ0_9EURY|nr:MULTISPECIES: hypothetical protein [Halarchaeum]MBP2251661.1 hypothetical protein [Halarchaeum solikamskense]GGN23402.1 hypothetical protein GCM10009021_26120 [Halarchaeum nitratireducens]